MRRIVFAPTGYYVAPIVVVVLGVLRALHVRALWLEVSSAGVAVFLIGVNRALRWWLTRRHQR